jgi:hypothetical protein
VKLAAPAALLLLLAALVAGCGGGGSTTVIERTVTVEKSEASGESTEGTGAGEAKAEEEEEAEAEEASAEKAQLAEEEAAEAEAEKHSGQPEDKVEAPTAVVHLQSFRSPSGNIGCIMFEGGARCDIRKRDWSPPSRPASCPEQVDFGQGLTVGHTGRASFVCAGDTALDPSAPQLAYGEASELGGTQCISSSDGITCANHTGHGFFVSIQSFKLF